MIKETIPPTKKTFDLKRGLRVWAEIHGVTPTMFSDTTGYRYAHAQGLMNGDRAVTFEMIGTFIKAYGPAATSELLALAGMPVAKVENLPHPEGAEVIPVVYVANEETA
jgi:hypothetical protein